MSFLPTNIHEEPFFSMVLDYSVKHDFRSPAGAHILVLVNSNGDEIELIEKNADTAAAAKLSGDAGLYGLRINVSDIEEAKKSRGKRM